MGRCWTSLLGGVLLVAPVSLTAQQPAAPQPASPASATNPAPSVPCALHIWPAATTHTTFQGWWQAGAVDGARRGIKGYPDMRADAIDAKQQALILKDIDWRAAMADPALDVVVHDAPSPGEDERGRTTRLVASTPACYSELIVTSSIVEVATFSTRSVRVQALRKTFKGDATPVNFASMSKAVIDLPEQIKPGDPLIDAATRRAFAEAMSKFAVMQSFH